METGGGDPVLTVDAQFSKLFESLIYNQKEQSDLEDESTFVLFFII